MTFEEWLAQGIARGWCSEVVCETHNGLPMSDEEQDAFEDGWDPCVFGVRVYERDD